MEKLNKGDKVICHGYEGSIIREYCKGMYEVRLARGSVCVGVKSIKKASK